MPPLFFCTLYSSLYIFFQSNKLQPRAECPAQPVARGITASKEKKFSFFRGALHGLHQVGKGKTKTAFTLYGSRDDPGAAGGRCGQDINRCLRL